MKECEVYPPKVGSGGGKLLPTLYGKHVMARHAVRVMLCALLPLGMAIVPFGPQISLAGAAEKKGDAKKKVNPIEEMKINPVLMFRVALRYSQRGLYTRAIPILAAFVQAFPNRVEHRRAAYMLADAYFFIAKTGVSVMYDNAIAAFTHALVQYPQAPQMPSAYMRLGRAYKAKKKYAEAQVAFRSLLRLAPESPQAPQALLQIAERYMVLEDPKSAIVEYSKILKKYRGSPAEKDAHFGIANALFKRKLFPDALRQFDVGKKRWPEFFRVRSNLLYNYAESLFQVRNFSRAGAAFLRMVNVNPTSDFSHRALARLGDIQLELGRTEEAIRVYSRVISTYPKTEGAWVSLIRIADIGVEGKFKLKPSWVFQNVAMRDPQGAYWRVIKEDRVGRLAHVAYLRIAAYHLKNGDLRDAIKAAQTFLSKFPKSRLANNANIIMARAYFEEVGRFYRREQFLRAIRTYGEFRSIVPDRASILAKPYKAMVEAGESYLRLGLYKEANKIFEKILGDPQGIISAGGEAIFRLAQSSLLSGDRKKAKDLALSFVRRFPKGERSPSIRAILGEIGWLDKDPRTAVDMITEALKGNLDNELRARTLFVLSEANAEIFHYAESIEALRKAIALYPKVPGKVKPFSLELASFRLGDVLYEGRRWIGSLVAYMGAVEAFPKSKLAGWAYHRIGKIQVHLNLKDRLKASKKPTVSAVSDRFWSSITQFRLNSSKWEKKNRSRMDQLEREGLAN
ncbi:MAG TPA: hypothetical protein DDZ83_03710 [Nitrospinae bacterium]|nr:hypothetical protein [Nitrospinota bacterium]